MDITQLIVPQNNGLTSETGSRASKSSDDDQNTFLMLMQLMFPKPEESLDNKMSGELQTEEVSQDDDDGQENQILNDGMLAENGEDSDAANLALMLNWMGYEANRSQQGEEVASTDGQDGEKLEATDTDFNSKSSSISLQSKLAYDAEHASQVAIKLPNDDQFVGDEPTFNLSADENQQIKQSSDLEPTGYEEISNAGSAETLLGTDKQAQADKLISELLGKAITSPSTSRETNTVVAGPTDSSTATQVTTASQLMEGMSSPQATQLVPKTVNMSVPMTHQDWSAQFNQQIVWLSQQQIKSAVIHLNPKEMGALEVNLKLDNNHAVIQMTAQHDGVRDSIEQSIPRLREMMHDQGIQLGDVNVQTRQQEQGDRNQSSDGLLPQQFDNDALIGGEQSEGTQIEVVKISKGLVDYFA